MKQIFNLQDLLPEHIQKIKPYSSARDEFSGEANVFLDANENSFGSVGSINRNRYPDPHQKQLKQKIGEIKNVSSPSVFLGNGSDEVIDLLYRAFCKQGVDKVLLLPPTYGMYEVCANLNNVEIINSTLTPDFMIDRNDILEKLQQKPKLTFLCTPNNPSANSLDNNIIEEVIRTSEGIVVIDEAYSDFSEKPSWTSRLDDFPNLVVMQTFSKAWGLANIRLGMAFTNIDIINVLDKIKPPYNVNGITQEIAMNAILNVATKEKYVKEIILERKRLEKELLKFSFVEKVFPSDANFILIKTDKPRELYNFLLKRTIVVRDRSSQIHCSGCLRITIGNYTENEVLLKALTEFC